MMRSSSRWLVFLAAAGCAAAGCATAPPPANGSSRELVLGYDEVHPSATMAFPESTYECLIRFVLPDGEHQPVRLRFQAAAPGSLSVNIYDTTPLESPGEVLWKVNRELAGADVSDGKDGRWVVEDLREMKAMKGVVWVGFHMTGGSPTLWTSSRVSGQTFVRKNDPTASIGLLPTKRTLMVRLEVTP